MNAWMSFFTEQIDNMFGLFVSFLPNSKIICSFKCQEIEMCFNSTPSSLDSWVAAVPLGPIHAVSLQNLYPSLVC